jgi:hypothetical protein
MAALMLSTATRDHTLTLSRIEAGAAKIVIDPFLADNPSWDKGEANQPCR